MRILLVEDEAPLRETLGARLKREGYAVDMASDGDEGLYMGREVPFDVAVIDLGLPKIDRSWLAENVGHGSRARIARGWQEVPHPHPDGAHDVAGQGRRSESRC